MGFVPGDIIVREVDAQLWELRAPVSYEGAQETFTVPDGFLTDFASIPKLAVWLIPRYGVYTRAAILHDYLCKEKSVDRADADGLFRRSMRELGVSMPRRWMMWAAVRLNSHMRNADLGQWLGFLVVAPLSIVFLAIPVVVVQVWLLLFWALELLFWGFHRLLGKTKPPVPHLQVGPA